MFSSARQKPFRSVGFRGTIHSPKLHAKVSAAKSKLSDISHVQSRDVQYMSHVVMQLLKRGRSFQALRKIFENLKDASETIGWEPEKFILFPDNFPIRLLSPFNWTFTDGRESKFKSCSFWIRSQLQTGLTLGIAFWAFAQLLLLSINHCKERNWTRN